jgi:hypothetical protein
MQGDYEVKLQAEDQTGAELFCMLVDFTIQPPTLKAVGEAIRELV